MKNLKVVIEEALEEAEILEMGRTNYDPDNMLLTAMRLSGAPYSFIEYVANQKINQAYA